MVLAKQTESTGCHPIKELEQKCVEAFPYEYVYKCGLLFGITRFPENASHLFDSFGAHHLYLEFYILNEK